MGTSWLPRLCSLQPCRRVHKEKPGRRGFRIPKTKRLAPFKEASTNLKSNKEHELEAAAITIQAAFRGYLCREALRALKGVVKIQALIRGWAVRKQTINTLKSLQSIVNLQSELNSQAIRTTQGKDIQMHCDWGSLSKEEIKAVFLTMKHTSYVKERVLGESHSFNERRPAKTECDNIYTRRYWMNQWVDSHLAKGEADGMRRDSLTSAEISSRRSYHHHRNRLSTGDDRNSMPTYMGMTESSKAKARSKSTPRQRYMKARSKSTPRQRYMSFYVCSALPAIHITRDHKTSMNHKNL